MALGPTGVREGLTLSSQVDDEALFDRRSVAFGLFMRLLFTPGGVEDAGSKATVMDLRTLADGLSGDHLLKAVATQLQVPPEDLDSRTDNKNHRENAEKNYQRINNALGRSAAFIRDELKFPLPAQIANTRVTSSEDIVELLRKTTAFERGGGGLDRHLAYCALIKGALAAIELETRYASELVGEADYLQGIITTPRLENRAAPLVIPKPFTEWGKEIIGTLSAVGEPPCDVTFEIRDKTWRSIMRKFMSKADANAKEAYKDEIALRFKLDGRRLGTVERILDFFESQFQAETKMITNRGVMGRKEFDDLFETLKVIKGSENLAIDPESNPKSDPTYAMLQITGSLKVPPGGDLNFPRSEWRERSFELQFIDEARKPHTGLASDAIYTLKKDIIIASRLFGGFEKKWLLDHAILASLDKKYTNMTPAEIFAGLLEQGYIFKKPGSHDKYASASVWNDWLKIGGLVTVGKMRSRIEFSVKAAMQKREKLKSKAQAFVE